MYGKELIECTKIANRLYALGDKTRARQAFQQIFREANDQELYILDYPLLRNLFGPNVGGFPELVLYDYIHTWDVEILMEIVRMNYRYCFLKMASLGKEHIREKQLVDVICRNASVQFIPTILTKINYQLVVKSFIRQNNLCMIHTIPTNIYSVEDIYIFMASAAKRGARLILSYFIAQCPTQSPLPRCPVNLSEFERVRREYPGYKYRALLNALTNPIQDESGTVSADLVYTTFSEQDRVACFLWAVNKGYLRAVIFLVGKKIELPIRLGIQIADFYKRRPTENYLMTLI